jgi:ComEC/Rec2-related protein
MHLLAVSGLHVGLIWWVLQHLTGWMNHLFRKGIGQGLLVVGLLWFYAYITGFSSSVCRSVTMFSFFSISRMRGERTQTLNVILASAFLLVLIDPLRLMDIGFQLSYAAVTGIVTLHPLSMRVLRVRNRVLRWIWEAASVSLAAQLVTAPLVIYYFHQLPLYSLITSMVAIPLLSVLIALFVCSIPFTGAGIFEHLSSFLLVFVAGLMNRSVEFLSALPGAVLEKLHLEGFGLLVWLLALLLILISLHGRSRLPFYLILLLISISLSWNTCSGIKRRSGSELVIAHFRGISHVSLRRGSKVDHYCWYGDSISMTYAETYRARAWKGRVYENRLFEEEHMGEIPGGASYSRKLGEGIWVLGAEGISGLVLRGPDCKKLPDLRLYGDRMSISLSGFDFILLSGEPPVEVLQIKNFTEELTLVIDGSNRSWYKAKIPRGLDDIYLTDLAGAYVKRW